MPILTPMKQQITLGDVADINVVSGPTMLKTENARLRAGFISMLAAGIWCRW
jgi:Cu/Ag efflux pump CusA